MTTLFCRTCGKEAGNWTDTIHFTLDMKCKCAYKDKSDGEWYGTDTGILNSMIQRTLCVTAEELRRELKRLDVELKQEENKPDQRSQFEQWRDERKAGRWMPWINPRIDYINNEINKIEKRIKQIEAANQT